jgi:hypothetical protein
MTKIVNCNVPGDAVLSGYAGPVGGGRGSKRNFCKRVKLKLAQCCAFSLTILFTGLSVPAATQAAWFGTLGNGRFDGWRDIVSAMALPFGLFTGCSQSTGSPTANPPNIDPVAKAGGDQTITLPTSSVTLDGSASSDIDGSIASYAWTQISKPSGASDAVISSPTSASTTVRGLTTKGKYTFQLKVTDDDGAESVDAVDVNVKPTLATKNVTVSFPTFNLSSNDVTEINLTPSFTPDASDWGVFNASDITFTITDNKGNGNDAFPGGKVKLADVNALYGSNWPWPPPLYTITFFDKSGNELGKYKIFIGDLGSNGYFNRVAADDGNAENAYDASDTQFTTGISPAPPLTLTLSKEVTE